MPRPRKQLLLKLGVFLLLLSGGAIINVAVAWGCALLVTVDASQPPRHRLHIDFEKWWGIIAAAPDRECFAFIVERVGGCKVFVEWQSLFPDIERPPRVRTPWPGPSWTPLVIAKLTDFAVGDILLIDARGWPMISLYSLMDCERNVVVSGIRISEETAYEAAYSNAWLPIRPLWPGFAINTIFYTALLWVLIFAPGKVRRLMRIRRECCPACGYKIDSAPGIGPRCSECGAELPARLRPASP